MSRVYVLEERRLLAGGGYVVTCTLYASDRDMLLARMAVWITTATRTPFRPGGRYAATGGPYRLVIRETMARTIRFAELETRFDVRSPSPLTPAVWPLGDGTVLITVLTPVLASVPNPDRPPLYDAFHVAGDGVVLEAPIGYSYAYRPGRILDLADAITRYAVAVPDA